MNGAVTVTPLHYRILVKRVEKKEPDTAKEKPQEGEVIAVGAGKRGSWQGTGAPCFGKPNSSPDTSVPVALRQLLA